jgi:3-oxoacyl-[acyl-carrier protein] reductase
MNMKHRIVLVTGASRGIGAATAKLLAAQGASVAVNYFQSEAEALAIVKQIREADGKAVAVKADVRELAQVQAMVAQVRDSLGPIDTLVSNASIQFPVVPFVQYEWEAFESKLTGELKAAFFCCKAVVPSMIENKAGCIVAISSGLSRHPGLGFCAHSTAKSGLDAFMKSLALELGPHGIRVNVVAPGLTETDATRFLPKEHKDRMAWLAPLRRIAQPEDVAGAVLALACDQARFLTGVYVPVSGGSQMI